MDHVSVYRCGQKFTNKSAIKFENALGGSSTIKNSAIHQGRAPGIIISKSVNINLTNNVVADMVEHGIWAMDSRNLIVTDNWVIHIIDEADKEPTMFYYSGWKGGITLSEGNTDVQVIGNIVAGTWHHGFHFVPSQCGEENPSWVFENNIAHSISGYGAIALNVENDCTEVHDFKAYKVTEAAIMLGGPSKINKGIRIRAIDTGYGIAVMSANGGRAELEDSRIYGEVFTNIDCPENSPCDHCIDAGFAVNIDAEFEHLDR